MKVEKYKDENDIWHVDNVAIISTGIEYPLKTGPTTFTEDQLADAVAAYADPAVKAPRIKLGHTSEYNAALIGDAEQAFGRAENLRLGNFGQTIYGDYVGLPEWLATVLEVAYPSRSIEGDFDIETNTGRSYKMVISAVSQLGIYWPGCSTLEDLPLFYGSDVPPGVEFDDPVALIAARNGGGMKPGEKIKAAVDVDLVKRSFYADVAEGDQYWWWIRGVRFDDNTGLQLIVDCDDGSLVRVPVAVSGSDINFGDPIAVTEEYPDKVAASAFVAGLAVASDDMLVYASRAETTDRPIKATQGGGTMDEATRQAMATRLGLSEDATEDQINAEIERLRTLPGGDQTPPAPPATPVTPPDPKAVAAPLPPVDPGPLQAVPPNPEPPTDENGENGVEASGPVTLDRETFNSLKAGAELAQKHERDRVVAGNAEVVDNAIKAGKFSPARRDHYMTLMGADPVGTKQMIDTLEAGAIPLNARGNAGNGGENSNAGGNADEGLPDEWFGGDIAKIRGGHIPGRTHRIMNAKEA